MLENMPCQIRGGRPRRRRSQRSIEPVTLQNSSAARFLMSRMREISRAMDRSDGAWFASASTAFYTPNSRPFVCSITHALTSIE